LRRFFTIKPLRDLHDLLQYRKGLSQIEIDAIDAAFIGLTGWTFTTLMKRWDEKYNFGTRIKIKE